MTPAEKKILSYIRTKPGQKGGDIALVLGLEKKEANKILYGLPKKLVHIDDNFRWFLNEVESSPSISEIPIDESATIEEGNIGHAVEESDGPPLEVEAESEHKGFAFDTLEAVRKKLLDLSGRNSLLNYKHPKASCVRLIDELPDQITEYLQSGKGFTFIPVPEPTEPELIHAGYIEIDPETGQKKINEYPTAEQWAKYQGLITGYDLPESDSLDTEEAKHQDNKLQTMLYAPELEARLRSLRSRSETAIQESGANVLFLAIGFLEWYEHRESDVTRIAPLMTLPVRLERTLSRKGGNYCYTITVKDDAILTNITLREKLANDFNLLLPVIEDEMLPEACFDMVKQTVLCHQPRWKIRRYATLALLNFSKQAMYEDLNPEHWPEDQSIEEHPIIGQFFSAADEEYDGSGLSYAEEHPIDHVEDIHELFPLIYDADSSQHSALIDAVKGQNLVIEGPPGSGKSQTITNLIAASIANGKRVLFVAEKMAALNVVKSRLDRAGLGDFCLELHSHKTQKQKILSDLNERINKQDSYRFTQLQHDIARFEDLKHKLHQYVELINSPWRETGQTIHQILNKATRYREQLKVDPDALKIEGIDGNSFTQVRQKEFVDQAEILANIHDQVAEQAPGQSISNHYWYGVNNTEIMGYQADSLSQSLHEWTDSLKSLSELVQQLNNEFYLGLTEDAPLPTIISTVNALGQLPSLQGSEQLGILRGVIENQREYESQLSDYESIHESMVELSAFIRLDRIDEKTTLSDFSEVLKNFKYLGIKSSTKLHELALDCERLEEAMNCAVDIDASFQTFSSSLPNELQNVYQVSVEGLREFVIMAELLAQLPSDLWRYRDDVYDDPDVDMAIKKLTPYFASLLPLRKNLIKHFNVKQLPSPTQLRDYQQILSSGGIFSWFSAEWRQAKKSVLVLANQPIPDKKIFFQQLPALIKYAAGLAEIERLHKDEPVLGELYSSIDTPFERITAMRKWYKQVRQEYGVGFGSRVPLGNALLKLDRNLAAGLSDLAAQGLIKQCKNLLELIDFCKQRYKEFRPIANSGVSFNEVRSPFNILMQEIAPQLKVLSKSLVGSDYTVGDVVKHTATLFELQEQKSLWNQNARIEWFGTDATPLSVAAGHYSEYNLDVAKNTLAIARIVEAAPVLLNAIEYDSSANNYLKLADSYKSLHLSLIETEARAGVFASQGDVDLNQWTDSSKNAINSLIVRNESALAHPLWLNTWLDYKRMCKKLSDQGMLLVLNNLEAGNISSNVLRETLELVISHQLANEILEEHDTLALFSGMEQMAIRDKFRQYDRKLLELQRSKIAYRASRKKPPAGNARGKVSSYTDTALIRHEGGKKSRLIPIRRLIKQAGDAISAVKPCFMMSPMSVAQYLPPGQFKFDLVVMDEASQIRPEDALGAIARGSSLVVVGDPKQLPPTSFFQKVVNDEDEEDIVALQDSESILESVLPMFKTRRLRWHYRSRHESLIAFSNKQFYDSNLILFPSPFQTSEEFGIRFSRIENGRFTSRRNVEEAKAIVQAVGEQFINNPDESVGVVAMNTEQRDEIERQLDQLIKDTPQLQMAYERNLTMDEPLFIKNLENVQGDERDVIIISMTYGPEQVGGRVMQRFGPINSDVGWRRLNVLFTRSKKRMHIFSSMGSGDIIVGGNSKRGVVALKAFLGYCETGHLHQAEHTGKPADSDFEIAVMQALADYGYECEPQLGVAGYFLDLAVKDPGLPGRFLMAVECDGATYHSAKSTRDRDRLRQEVLEGLGWKVRRIWSTDWFKNPQAQLQPILADLESLKTPFVEHDETQFKSSAILDSDEAALEEEYSHEVGKIEESQSTVSDREEIDLEERLLRFDRDVIRIEYPNTDENARLLRIEMIDAILEHLPCSKAEFVECIPGYLRFGTSEKEGEYLEQVLELVAEYA